jgi:hypothetical protein
MAFLTGDVNIICGMINNTLIGNNTPSIGVFTNINTNGLEINDLSGTEKYIFGVSNLSSDITITLPALTSSDTFVFENQNQTLTNKTITDSTNVVTASELRTLGGDVNISMSPSPKLDQVLQITSPTMAIWQHLPNRRSVRVATIGPGILATDFEAGDMIDGITLSIGDRILIKNQGSAVENGIYTVNAVGAPFRAMDYTTGDAVASTFMFIQEGVMNGDTGWLCTNNTGTDVVGTDSLTFIQFSGSGGGGGNKLATYPLSTIQISANMQNYTTVTYFPWINSLYSSYTNGRLLISVIVTNRTLDIRLQDTTNAVTIASSLGIAVNGFYMIAVTNPTSDAQIELQVRKSGPGGGNPQILGVTLEFDC